VIGNGGRGYLLSDRHKPTSNSETGALIRRETMKAIVLALTILAATGAPVLADGFPNPYQTNFDR
jgi:hypothetical protein